MSFDTTLSSQARLCSVQMIDLTQVTRRGDAKLVQKKARQKCHLVDFFQEPSFTVRVCRRGTKDRGPTVRGFPRRFGRFTLRGLLPFGAFGFGQTRPRPWSQRWSRRRPRLPGIALATTDGNAVHGGDHAVPDCRVLDYRALEGVRLVFGEIYADH